MQSHTSRTLLERTWLRWAACRVVDAALELDEEVFDEPEADLDEGSAESIPS